MQRARYDPKTLRETETLLNESSPENDRELVPGRLFPGDHPISRGSLRELITPGSDYDIFPFGRPAEERSFVGFVNASGKYKTACIYGSDDFGVGMPVKGALKILSQKNPEIDTYEIPESDHSFHGKEKKFADLLAKVASR